MDFIFMLTRADQTVPDCLDVMAELRPLGLRHIGFKDVGVDHATLAALNAAIQNSGATSYLEVVSETADAALRSARTARQIGVNRLLGGSAEQADAILELLAGSGIEYFPFAGTPVGHPTDLRGDSAQVQRHCQDFMAKGCHGVDLLAYRAVESEPLDLVRAARTGLGSKGLLVCAGSVDSPRQIDDLAAAGCDAFTIGSAVFERAFAPDQTTLTGQLDAILSLSAVRSR